MSEIRMFTALRKLRSNEAMRGIIQPENVAIFRRKMSGIRMFVSSCKLEKGESTEREISGFLFSVAGFS
jgi:hypothetical protein